MASARSGKRNSNMSCVHNVRRMSLDNVNPFVKATDYAVRGELSIRADALDLQLKEERHGLPFTQIVPAHIGNPHGLGQKPITFFRQVLSLLENPTLLQHEQTLCENLGYKSDAVERARSLLSEVRSLGSYSPSQGFPAIRRSVARFIEGDFLLPHYV